MRRSRAFAFAAALLLLTGCGAARAVGGILPFKGKSASEKNKESEEGRISILTFEQKLVPDKSLAGRSPTVPAAADVKDWSQPGGSADNAPGNIATADALRVAWREDAGEGSSRVVHLSAPPVIADGRLYLVDAGQVLRAFDASRGHKLWSQSLRPKKTRDRIALGGGVAVLDGLVFATTGFGEIIAFKADTGEQVWRTAAGAPFLAAPTAAGGRVYAVTNDSELMALDAATGQVAWTHQAIAEPARILAASSPAVVGDTVIAPFASGEVTALLAANGRRLWVDALTRAGRLTSLSAINDIAGRPVFSEGVVYAVSHSGVIAAIDERSGQRIWARGIASTQTPCVAGDTLYLVTVDGEVAALDKASGAAFWVRQLPRYENEKKQKGRIAWTGPILVGGNLLLASSTGQAVLLSPTDGQTKSTLKIGKPVFVPPIAAGGTVYLLSDDGKLIALR
jgi:outer membrane protein assembly factor BamB